MSPPRTRLKNRHHGHQHRKSNFSLCLSYLLIISIIVVQLALYSGVFDPPKNVKQSQATTTTSNEQNTFQVSEAQKQAEFGPRDAPMSRISYEHSPDSGDDGAMGGHVGDDDEEGEGGGDLHDDDNEVEEDSEDGEDGEEGEGGGGWHDDGEEEEGNFEEGEDDDEEGGDSEEGEDDDEEEEIVMDDNQEEEESDEEEEMARGLRAQS